jgi:WhiB family redox-sensing transcriptional regulator
MLAKQRQQETRNYKREEVRTMSVLFSELLVPGWADEKIGLDAVTGTYSDGSSFNLPCHTADPEMYFSDDELAVAEAKSLCGGCPVRAQCLEGALSRKEPAGVWGGELFEDGRVISRKRKAGRPTAIEVAAREVNAPIQKLTVQLEAASPISSQSEREESAA